MDDMTQQNAALVEQAAAAAESLHEQTVNLSQAISIFKIEGAEPFAATPAAAEEQEEFADPLDRRAPGSPMRASAVRRALPNAAKGDRGRRANG
jgi:methyl-accepting chemotaxis protein